MEQGKPFGATESPLVDFDGVCQKVRNAIEPARAHAVSLHDEKGDVLWLSESSMGPDEHNAVREAVESFSSADAPPVLAYDLGDGRSAVLLRAVSSRRALVGTIMLIMDTRAIKPEERALAKLLTPKLQRVLADFVAMRPDLAPPPTAPPKAAVVSLRGDRNSGPPARNGAAPASSVPARGTNAGTQPATVARSAPGAARTAPSSRAPIELTLADTGRLSMARTSQTPARTSSPAPPRASPARSAPPEVAPNASAAQRPAASAPPRATAPISSRAGPAPPSRTVSGPSPRAAAAPSPRVAPALASSNNVAPQAGPVGNAVPPAQHRATHKSPQAPVTPEVDRLHAALRSSPIALHVQHLVPLTKGSQLRRYEVLLRSKSEDGAAPQAMLKTAVDSGLGSMIDRRVLTELVGWLVHHPDAWQHAAVMFSVNLTATALHDEHFIKFVELCLAKSSLPKAMIAFEVDVSTAVKLASRVADVAAALHRLGCPMVLDDFGMRTECFELLRLPGVRYIKLASDITAKMRTDKVSQAAITAVVQMARVLGMHTVAKRTETPAEQEWLTALGVDFVQSHAMSPPAPLDTLSSGKAKH
jgi:EAL domain-containing protein (putative c-di-GMP-specific phosphodiesterase class I)